MRYVFSFTFATWNHGKQRCFIGTSGMKESMKVMILVCTVLIWWSLVANETWFAIWSHEMNQQLRMWCQVETQWSDMSMKIPIPFNRIWHASLCGSSMGISGKFQKCPTKHGISSPSKVSILKQWIEWNGKSTTQTNNIETPWREMKHTMANKSELYIKKTTQNNTKGHHRMSPQWLRTPTTQRISCEVKVPSRHGMRFIVTAVVKLLHDSIWTNQKKQIQKLDYTLSDCSENMWKLQIPTGISQKTHKFSGLWSSIWQIACSSWPTWPISKGKLTGLKAKSYSVLKLSPWEDFNQWLWQSRFWGDSNEVASQNYEGGIKGWLIQPCKKNTDVCVGFNSAFNLPFFCRPPKLPTTSDLCPIPLAFFWVSAKGLVAKKTQAFHWFQAWALWIEDVHLKNSQNHWKQTLLLEDPIKYLIFPKNQCACITPTYVDCMHIQ